MIPSTIEVIAHLLPELLCLNHVLYQACERLCDFRDSSCWKFPILDVLCFLDVPFQRFHLLEILKIPVLAQSF